MTLRAIRVFTTAFRDRPLAMQIHAGAGSGASAIAITYSLLRWKKRLKRKAVAQRVCAVWKKLASAVPRQVKIPLQLLRPPISAGNGGSNLTR